jgi:peptidoglycan/xylan/chitin deacetylase (PgdA/CDA1 family)
MKQKGWITLILLVIAVASCGGAAPAAEQPAAVEAAAEVAVATDAPPLATELPTATALPMAAPATPTALPTVVATAVPTAVATETPEPTAAPMMADEGGDSAESDAADPDALACRPREQMAGIRQTVGVVPGPYNTVPASETLLFNTNGRGYSLIHLGFDVEGTPDHLEELLDVLDRHGVKTSMFILGSWAEAYPEWVKEFHRRGHELVNHSYSHGNFREMDAAQVAQELQRTDQIVRNLTGENTTPWFRPPFGSRSDESIAVAAAEGWSTVVWSGSTDDWRVELTEDDMCANLMQGGWPGSILYSHTYREDIPSVVDRFLGEMQSRGYVFVPLSVLMAPDPSVYLTAQ